jgi:zinc protease
MRRLAALALSLFTAAAAFAATPQPKSTKSAAAPAAKTKFDAGRFRVPYKKFVLDNGLTLLVHTDHSVPIVAVNTWYHVGSRNEKRGKTGFAHLFEHFFFNGSENYPHGFREAMDDLGANNRNGTTSTDRTNFFEDVPVSALERTLYLEADRMGFLAGNLSKEMLERERGVVQNEKRQGENQPYGKVFLQIQEVIYPYSHPYSWSTIGSMDDLNAASMDDIRDWYKTYYGPNNCVLALAGDITAENALALVKKYFDGIPPGPPLRRIEQWIPRLDRNMRDEMEDRVPETRIYRAYHVPGFSDPQIQHLGLLADVLSGSKSSRLDRRLVYEKNLLNFISAGVFERELAGMLVITASLKPGVDPAVVEKEIDTVIGELLANGPTAAELERAKTTKLANHVRGTERLGGFGGRSDVLAQSQTFGGDPEAYLQRLGVMANASAADVVKSGKRWIGDATHYTMVVKPMAKLAPGKSAVDRKQLPALTAAPDVSFPEVQRTTLSNGLEVMLLERHSTPIVNLALAIDAGYAADRIDKAGLASLTLDVMDEGTKTRDVFRIVDDLDSLGARITTGNSLDLSFVRLQALPMNLRPSLDIYADVILNPSFPEDQVTLLKRQRISRINTEKVDPTSMALRVFPRLLYGGEHAYGNPFTGSGYEKTVTAITRDDLAAWHRAWFHPNNATMIVTGDVTMAQLKPELERAFASWPRGDAPKKNLSSVARTAGRKVYLIDKPDAPQSVIVAAHVTEPGGQAEELALEMAMRNFGGIATSRLNRNLRLEKHWSYGTSGQVIDARGQRPFLVVAPVQTDKTKESMVEVAKEIRGFAGERPVAGEEFASIMRNSTLRLPGRFETLGALETAATHIVNYGYADDYFANYAKNVRTLNEASLATASTKFIHPDEVVWVIVGDLKKIEAGVRELGFGEVTKIEVE